MPETALRFSSLLNRLKLIGATIVYSPPAPDGWIWLFGKKEGVFPYSKGPMYPMKLRDANDMVPARMISKILKNLKLAEEEATAFWSVQEHQQASAARNA